MSKVKYIAETKSFIIDGKIIKESELPPDKVIELKKLAENWQLILGTTKMEGQLII